MSFNFVAPIYDLLASLVFGRTLRLAQVALLRHLPQHVSVLLLGGGSGWLLEQVLTQCQPTQVLYLDASERMLALTRHRIRKHPQREVVTLRHGTEATLSANEQFAIILTPFVLDLFPAEILNRQLVPRIHKALAVNGYWLITDFVPTTVWWHRWLTSAMYRFFRLTAGVEARQLPNWSQLLSNYTNLTTLGEKAWWQGFIVSRLYQRAE